MSIPDLPLEIIVLIGSVDIDAWRDLLAIPDFGRWTLSDHSKKIRHNFLVIRKNNITIKYYLRGNLHNFDDAPAIIAKNSHIESFGLILHEKSAWYHLGKLHRDNGPAVIWSNGTQEWYQNGLLHRDNDLPAIIRANGDQQWFQNGKCHRDNGPASIDANGKCWVQHGEICRYVMHSVNIRREKSALA